MNRAASAPAPGSPLLRAVARAQVWLTAIYRLELDLSAEQFVVDPQLAQQLLPPDSPRSGVLVIEDSDELSVGLYLHAEDARDPDAVLEETSHLLYLAWLADREWSVSRLVLELQSEVDRYAVARVRGREALEHFGDYGWCDWVDAEARELYETAHRSAHRYCRELERRYPRRSDTPELLSALRRFYRAPPDQKLRFSA